MGARFVRRTGYAVAGVLAATFLMGAPSGAEGAVCGRPSGAIVVSDPAPYVGTEGPDSIVITGDARVDTRGGADWVCIEGTGNVTLDTGNGDDTVIAEGELGLVAVTLGEGRDRYNVGPGSGVAPGTVVDLSSVSVDAGPGDDWVTVGFQTSGADLDGGPGNDRLEIFGSERTDLSWIVRVDAGAGTWSSGPQGSEITGIATSFRYHDLVSPIVRFDGPDDRRSWAFLTACRATAVGGQRGDSFTIPRSVDDFGSYSCPGDNATATLKGRGGSDRLQGKGGTFRLLGGGGRDHLLGHGVLIGGSGADRLDGAAGADVLKGGRGADRLRGGRGKDRLLGQRGHDRADGQRGNDLCRAERRKNCERR